MSNAVRKVLDDALALPQRDRAEVAAQLLQSLHGEDHDPELVRKEWAAEITRRAQAVLDGDDNSEDWEVVRARLLAKN